MVIFIFILYILLFTNTLWNLFFHAYIFFLIVSESKQKDLTKRRRWSYLGLSPMTFCILKFLFFCFLLEKFISDLVTLNRKTTMSNPRSIKERMKDTKEI